MLERIRVFSGNANLNLAQKISENLGISLGKANVTSFSDGETRVEINENVRGMDVFIIQPTCPPVNVTLMELLIMIDAVRRSSADRITAVIPYYGYGRQDRKVAPRAPITAKLVADLITRAGANRVLAMDLHAGQIQGKGQGLRLVPQDTEGRRHGLDLHEHVLLVRRGAGIDFAVENDGLHVPLIVRQTPAPRLTS